MLSDLRFDGFVGLRNVSVGDFVQVGQKILLLEDLKRLKFDFKVPEKYINDIKEGNEIKIFTEITDQAITAKVDVLNVNVEKNGRFLLVRSFVNNSDFFLIRACLGRFYLNSEKKIRASLCQKWLFFLSNQESLCGEFKRVEQKR